METETGSERVARYLDDAIALEAASIQELGNLAADASTHDDAALYRAYSIESQDQKQRLEARLAALGGAPLVSAPADILSRMGIAGGNAGNVSGDRNGTQSRHLLKALALESLEVAAYEMLVTAAEEIGDTETASLALRLQVQESVIARQLFDRIAPLSAGAVRRTALTELPDDAPPILGTEPQHLDGAGNSDAERGAVLGGAGSAAVGAIAGSMVGPAGAVLGAVVGGVVGAVASGLAVSAVDTVDGDSPREEVESAPVSLHRSVPDRLAARERLEKVQKAAAP